MQESNKVESAVQVQNEVKQDAFKVGDVVWDVVFGKGSVYKISEMDYYSIKVEFEFENGCSIFRFSEYKRNHSTKKLHAK